MIPEIDPEEAIKKTINFSNQIDPLQNMSYKDGETVKNQLNTRIRAFVRTIFLDDDKKIQDYDNEIRTNNRRFLHTEELEEQVQKRYLNDLDIMRNHLIGYKDELELLNNSRKKRNQTIIEDKTTNNEIKRVAIYGPAIPIPSPKEEYVIDRKGDIRVRLKNSNKVFVVHGHNDTIKDAVAAYLQSLDLEPIILHLQPSLGKTIIEKVEHYSNVGFAVILLTQDDLGRTLGPLQFIPTQEAGGLFSKKTVIHAGKPSGKQNPRARQNVIFEFGYFIGLLGRNRVAALCEEGIERPSDIDGLVYISLDNEGLWESALKKEIEAAGIKTGLKKLD
jgi:hypothetical protein